jgi:hypothetical protein
MRKTRLGVIVTPYGCMLGLAALAGNASMSESHGKSNLERQRVSHSKRTFQSR